MKKDLFVWVMFLVFLLVFFIRPAQAIVQVVYSLEDMGSGRWKATYRVDNLDVSLGVTWLSVYFDYGLYDTLCIETPSPLAEQWDQKIWNPQLIGSFPLPGLYDIQAISGGIPGGQSLAGFSISFDWLGEGLPNHAQRFEVYDDPENLLTPREGLAIYIPEPMTLFLLAAGALMTSRRASRRP